MGQSERNQQGKLLFPAIIILLLISAAAVGWYVFFHQQNNNGEPLLSSQVQRGSIEELVTATGILQPRDYVDVGAQVSGQLHRIHVDVGTRVKAGDLLAEIDPTLFMARVDASRAQLRYQQAQLSDRLAQLQLAEIQHRRQQNLLAGQATTEENAQNAAAAYQSARAQIVMLEAQIEQTESSLRADEANLGFARIFAPMDGTVVAIDARQGQTINANQQAPIILRIADLSTMTVQTRVSEADITRLKVGMPAYFTTLGGRERRWHGTLHRIEPTPLVENNVVLYNALFDVDNGGGRLLPHMTAQVFFVVAAAEETLLVPASAVNLQGAATPEPSGNRAANDNHPDREDDRLSRGSVIVLDSAGKMEPRQVEVGISNRIQMQVVSGLSEGERVLTHPAAAPQGGAEKAAGQRMGPPGSMPLRR
ncbi:MAG: efflux RND transporter periplasmic adaptor subunit [Pelovirga sp.]